ncbi:hypothetical protein D8674_009260 [Pyrus ussuriensis x Pyrus communis]|uniref:Uncharacterized protein n=1 Tax=Pyrus ussuriensis x Pyrus communis TaxID=2448454 RepID=A0A5N5HZW7_9ROSA|nr:hypothetical protein D8674_009260 [Pyrus ussuriensis x Pyrus communis]
MAPSIILLNDIPENPGHHFITRAVNSLLFDNTPAVATTIIPSLSSRTLLPAIIPLKFSLNYVTLIGFSNVKYVIVSIAFSFIPSSFAAPIVKMSWLNTHRRSVTNVLPALSASTAPGVSAPLIGEPTPLTETTPTTTQPPVSSIASVSVQSLSARWPHRHRHEPEPSNHTSSASRVEGEASQLGTDEGPRRGEDDLCRDSERPCTNHTDVQPPNLATST